MTLSSYYKFNVFAEDVGKEAHNLASDTLKILLTNTSPNAADTVVDTTTATCTIKSTSNAAEIAAGNGYTKGGNSIAAVTWAQTSGTAKLYGTKVTFTPSGGSIATFRYAACYNDSGGTTSTRPPICWFDYGSSISPGVGEPFIVGNSNDGTDWTSSYPLATLA